MHCAVDSAAAGPYWLTMAAPTQPLCLLHAPGAAEVAAFLARQRVSGTPVGYSYPEVGASRHNAEKPHGYDLDHNRIQIGSGIADFDAACAALRKWRMFPAPWARIAPADTPIETGEIVALQVRAFGLWWLNAARIVYVIEEPGTRRRFGFAYGTLPAHVEQGEERFCVELHADGTVWYDLRAFSRPRFWLARLAKPIARKLQAKFVRDSQRSMLAAVTEAATLREDPSSTPTA